MLYYIYLLGSLILGMLIGAVMIYHSPFRERFEYIIAWIREYFRNQKIL
ncbi:hypothetical protein RB2501_13869 [Robiginitalea biformata HTCC2501]|uniref:Uncharacterized protein n=1 Tax=Robiginitalea biformata (strain ATCC BAA-864 / DSM 15991 / KCTC 12146 / HTCC2501) TaxID=313596 RepID=A4CKM1_ROBBH|nr:hypothetical protein RB2501_13869 [Robiginitalea biformata HTCC2501]